MRRSCRWRCAERSLDPRVADFNFTGMRKIARNVPPQRRGERPATTDFRCWAQQRRQQRLRAADLEVQPAKSACNRHGLRVTVAHYPTAASMWNPIEHRVFCEISKNWAGRPLDSFETILRYLRTTRTTTGLRIRAHLVRKVY